MGKIKALELNKNKKRVTIILDSDSSLVVNRLVAEDAGLRKGLDLSEEQVKQLLEADHYQKCLDTALRFLAYRPRSELEIKQRLRRHGFRVSAIEKVLVRLKEQGLVNDQAFAQYWKDSRLSSSPKSRWLIKRELLRKGVDHEQAEQATSGLDDSVNAYQAGLKKARLLVFLDYEGFCKRMYTYLKWRGFNYEIIETVTERLWRERDSIMLKNT